MNEMVERVARAIREYWLEGDHYRNFNSTECARRAIASQHEPTAAMIAAAWQLPCVDGQEPSYGDVWRAMNDAMLTEVDPSCGAVE